MTHVHRAIIFYIFLLIFLVSAPLVVLYTSGYRYNFLTGRIALVGALSLKSTPRHATISLNDRTIEEKTPALLKLPPDEYSVMMGLYGYHPWKKLLSIRSKETTFAEDIILWKDTAPMLLTTIIPLALSKDTRHALSYDPIRGLLIINLPEGTITPIADLPIAINSEPLLSISPDEELALVTFQNSAGDPQVTVVRLSDNSVLETATLERLANAKLVWAETAGTLYAVRSNTLLAANLFTERVDAIARAGYPFLVEGTTILSILDNNQPVLARSKAGNPDQSPEPIATLPPGNYKILKVPEPFLILHETVSQRILVIDLANPTEIVTEMPGKNISTRTNQSGQTELLAWTDFELWHANLTTGATELLRRQSEIISSANWYPRGEYIAISSGDHVEMLELDSRGGRLTTTIASFPDHHIRSIYVNSDGTIMLITVDDGPKAGLYSLELQR